MAFTRTAPAQGSLPQAVGERAAPTRHLTGLDQIATLLAAVTDGYVAYAGIGSRETPADVLADMTLIAQALEGRGFTLRSGFAAGADTAFELGTTLDALREIFAPWPGFGSDPNSKWDRPRWTQIRAYEKATGRSFTPARAHVLTGALARRAEELAAQHHPAWARLADSHRKLHSRNMGQVLGRSLDTPARFVIAWTSDGQASGGTGQAIRVADDLGIPVLNLHNRAFRAEILRVLGLGAGVQPGSQAPATDPTTAGSVTYCSGNIVDDTADLLVNTVNTVGVMGAGVALAFKTRWPSIMAPYQAACRSRAIVAGGCELFDLPDGRRWAGLATKAHWRDPSQLAWIRTGLRQLAERARAAGVRSIAIPPPGCGNGGLRWEDVEPLVLADLAGFDLRIYARPSGAR